LFVVDVGEGAVSERSTNGNCRQNFRWKVLAVHALARTIIHQHAVALDLVAVTTSLDETRHGGWITKCDESSETRALSVSTDVEAINAEGWIIRVLRQPHGSRLDKVRNSFCSDVLENLCQVASLDVGSSVARICVAVVDDTVVTKSPHPCVCCLGADESKAVAVRLLDELTSNSATSNGILASVVEVDDYGSWRRCGLWTIDGKATCLTSR
jgi:hypothetical protein